MAKISPAATGKGVPSGGRGGVTPPHFLKFVGISTKRVGKISSSNVVEKFGVFYQAEITLLHKIDKIDR